LAWRLVWIHSNQRFDARNPLAPTKDLLTQAQYGCTIGGPMRRDRTFFFSNFEQTRRNYSAVITIEPGTVNTINNRLRALNYGGQLISTGVVPASFDTTNFFTRIDHSFNSRNQLSARYSLYHINAVNSRNVGGLNAVSRGTGLEDTDQTVQVSNVTTFNSRTLNEARFQYTNSRLDAPVNDTVGPAINITGIASLGIATFSPQGRDINLFEAVDNVSTQRGAHIVESSAIIISTTASTSSFPCALEGRLPVLYSVVTSSPGNYQTFQQAFGVPSQLQFESECGRVCAG
jgi:hypothetical protein